VAHWLDTHFIDILNGFADGLLLFTMAVGLSLIFGLMDVLNLAHGAVYMVGAYLAYQLTKSHDLFLLGLLAATLVGLVLGGGLAFAIRPVAHRGHLDQALLTLGLAVVVSDVTSWIWGGGFLSVPPPRFLRSSVVLLGRSYPSRRLAVIVVGLAVAVAVYLVFDRTQLGAIVRASVVDRDMVSALGINLNRVLIGVFALGTALAAFGGVVGTAILEPRPDLDSFVLIRSLIVVVIGGLGSIRGAFVGALIVGQVESLGVALLPQQASFLLFGAMALVLLFRPAGLFGDVTVDR
jgi:branched-chain amino acid transport system permease protein